MKSYFFYFYVSLVLIRKEVSLLKINKLIMVLVAALFLSLSPAHAALLGVDLLLPDILSNQTGLYAYTWDSNVSEGLFTARATPLTITYDGTTLDAIGGDRSYDVSFYVDGAGNFLRGVGGDDLVIIGDGNTLLTGEVTNFGWLDIPNTKLALFDFTFTVTGGTLASLYAGGLGGDIGLSENSSFSGDWMVNHEGIKIKHDTAPVVPVPATLWLLGGGLLGLVGLRRRKIN